MMRLRVLTSSSIQVHQRLVQNTADIAILLAKGLQPPQDSTQIRTEADALTCFQVGEVLLHQKDE